MKINRSLLGLIGIVASCQPKTESVDPWAVTTRGAGTAKIGMPDGANAECNYVKIADAPQGMWFMTEGGRMVRVEVREGPTPTSEGARIGDTEQRVLQLYPAARREPHKYTSGSYLIVIPGAPADTMYRYVFETDGSRVTSYRAGLYPQVQYVEGCG